MHSSELEVLGTQSAAPAHMQYMIYMGLLGIPLASNSAALQ